MDKSVLITQNPEPGSRLLKFCGDTQVFTATLSQPMTGRAWLRTNIGHGRIARQGNNWSYCYARRQWHLVDDTALKYPYLARFDREMIALARRFRLLYGSQPHLVYEHSLDKIIAFERSGLLFVFNFHPHQSFSDYRFNAAPGRYRLLFDSDASQYGGHGRLTPDQIHTTLADPSGASGQQTLSLYLPSRSAQVLEITSDDTMAS